VCHEDKSHFWIGPDYINAISSHSNAKGCPRIFLPVCALANAQQRQFQTFPKCVQCNKCGRNCPAQGSMLTEVLWPHSYKWWSLREECIERKNRMVRQLVLGGKELSDISA
jgi:hypothetical protein